MATGIVVSDLKLAVIGQSPGNGHPYSWSAIINGYERQAMESCGFPAIPRYLEQQRWPDARIGGARVTHVWTQDEQMSRSIAQATRIPQMAASLDELVGSVDAVLLARDDSQLHLQHAAPFLDAGLPIYIDKPIATSREKLRELRTRERFPGQIFTCSALRYSPELQLSQEQRKQVGQLVSVNATTPKAWNTYAVHVVEPVTAMLGSDRPVEVERVDRAHGSATSVQLIWGGTTEVCFTATGLTSATMSIEVVGDRGTVTLGDPSPFAAFKKALQEFIDGVRSREVRTNWRDVDRIVEILEIGTS